MEEIFDILTPKGQYTNKTQTREVCHKEGLYHKAVFVFIINSKSQVLLQKRSANKKMWPNMWDITAGGHVLAGEFGFEAIIRETKEELGIDLKEEEITFIGAMISNNVKGDMIDNHFNEGYIAHKDIDITKLNLQTEEVAEVKWMDKEEVIQKIQNEKEELTGKEGCWECLVKYLLH